MTTRRHELEESERLLTEDLLDIRPARCSCGGDDWKLRREENESWWAICKSCGNDYCITSPLLPED